MNVYAVGMLVCLVLMVAISLAGLRACMSTAKYNLDDIEEEFYAVFGRDRISTSSKFN
jgi:hypothetical protein